MQCNHAQQTDLPIVGSDEFRRQEQQLEAELVRKFAWTAQHDGIIYRDDPNAIRPMKDKVFNRVSKFAHSFPYLDSNGRRRHYFYRFQDILAVIDDPTLDFGFVFAERVEFLPGQAPISKDDLNRTVLNLWRQPCWEANPSMAEPTIFLEHMSYLFDHDPMALDHVLDYMAHLVQRPEQRVNHALLITSEAKGIGKSTLGNIIQRLVGERNSGVAQTKELKGQFDGWLMGKLVVQIDEIYEYGNWDLANKLKPLITEPTVSVNIKYGPQLTVQNFARLIMFSNHSAPIDLEDGDRRYFVFDSKAQPRPPDYYNELNAFIDGNPGMAAIFWWLKRRDLSRFKPYAAPPLTAHKQAIIDSSGNPLRHYLPEAVRSGHLLETVGTEFTIDALQRQLHEDGYGAQARNFKEIGAALKLAGVVQARASLDGKRTRVYRLPSPDPDSPSLAPLEF